MRPVPARPQPRSPRTRQQAGPAPESAHGHRAASRSAAVHCQGDRGRLPVAARPLVPSAACPLTSACASRSQPPGLACWQARPSWSMRPS